MHAKADQQSQHSRNKISVRGLTQRLLLRGAEEEHVMTANGRVVTVSETANVLALPQVTDGNGIVALPANQTPSHANVDCSSAVIVQHNCFVAVGEVLHPDCGAVR